MATHAIELKHRFHVSQEVDFSERGMPETKEGCGIEQGEGLNPFHKRVSILASPYRQIVWKAVPYPKKFGNGKEKSSMERNLRTLDI